MKHNKMKLKRIGLITFLIVIVILILGILKISNTYAEEVTIDGLKYTYTVSKKQLNIVGTGTITDSWQTSSELSKYVKLLENVVINSSENISIDDMAFKDCIALKNITISETCTMLSEAAFEGCISLETLTVIREGEENLQYIYTNGTWVEKKESKLAVNSEEVEEVVVEEEETQELNSTEETEETEETEDEDISLLASSVTKTLTESETTWTVTESGIYKVELFGEKGGSAKECEGGSRKLLRTIRC